MSAPQLTTDDRAALETLAADLRRVFGVRLQSVVAYALDQRAAGAPLHALALVERLTFDDLAACAPLTGAWRRRGMGAPLILEREEFERTLDIFPLEYGDIIARHVRVDGPDPFTGLQVAPADMRRAIEQHAKSLLIHLREGYLETGGDPRAVKGLVAASTPALRTLLGSIARLDGLADDDLPAAAEQQIGIPAATVRDVLSAPVSGTIEDPAPLFASYLAAAERIWEYVDGWRR